MLDLKTVNDIFFRVTASGNPRALLYQDAGGRWLPISADQIYQRTRLLTQAFLRWGISKGDRVAILSENRWEWALTDYAALLIGAVVVPIYPTLLAEQIAYLLNDSECRLIVLSTRKQYDKVESIREQTPLEHILIMDEEGTPDAVLFSSIMSEADSALGERDPELDRRGYNVQPEDLATLIYTSGTTGEPKGVMLSHGNIASNVNYSTAEFGFLPTDSCISFLPLSHITARHLDYALTAQNCTLAYCPTFEALPTAMTSVQPTIFVAVPRVYEKIRHEVGRRAALSAAKARLLAWAVSTGRKSRELVLRGEAPASPLWRLAHRLVFTKVRGAFGGRVRYFISGGAPLGLDTASWYADVGIRILEGYGLTETSPVLAINTPVASRMGSVGKSLSNVECKFAPDGELLVRGPNVFDGYWKKLIDTREAFDDEHWFRTGDIGRQDEDGFLYITDRKKELLKTSGGKLIAPQPIEGKLKSHLLVAEAALVGDRHKFASVLISPNFAALEEWARQQGIETSTRRQLVAHGVVVAEYQSIVNQVNASLANFETIKRLRVVPEEWTLGSGELTPSLKLKRRVIYERYADLIAEFYADEAVSRA